LEIVLEHLGSKTIILCGLTTNACVLTTAADLYIEISNWLFHGIAWKQ
jgi:nicotinamidase-related amidase